LEQRLQRLQSRGRDADLDDYVRKVEERLATAERRREETVVKADTER